MKIRMLHFSVLALIAFNFLPGLNQESSIETNPSHANPITDNGKLANTKALSAYSPGFSIGPQVRVSPLMYPAAHNYHPDVTYDWINDQFLVVWQQTWDSGVRQIYARYFSGSGQPLASAFRLNPELSYREIIPKAVYNATDDEFLVVFMYNSNGDTTTYDIRGRRLPSGCNSSACRPMIAYLSPVSGSESNPAVAWDYIDNRYLVIYEVVSGGSSPLVNQSLGYSCVDGGSMTKYGAITVGNNPEYSDLVYNPATDEFLVAWLENANTLRAARFDDGSGIDCIWQDRLWTIATTTSDWTMKNVSLATNWQSRYLAAWEVHQPPSQINIRPYISARELDAAGDQLHSSLLYGSGGISSLLPDLAVQFRYGNPHDGRWIVVWQEALNSGDDIQADIWQIGSETDNLSDFPIANMGAWNARRPAVIAGRAGLMVVYEGRSTDPAEYQHIYMNFLYPIVQYLPLVIKQ